MTDETTTEFQSASETQRRFTVPRTVAAAAAAIAATTLGVALVTTPVAASKATTPSRSHVDAQIADITLDDLTLDDVSLGELSDELAELGLELRIVPADADDWDDWESDDEYEEGGDGEEPLAALDVEGDRLDTSAVSADLADRANAIWERFVELIPAEQRTMVSAFELMDRNYGGAHVYADDNDPAKWVLGVGEGMNGDELDYVLIHEFGHLLTLNADAVPPSTAGEDCPTFELEEGCPLKSSVLNTFVQMFWPQDLQDELARIERATSDEEYDQRMTDFYQQYQDAFVTDYAASDPVEDLAEVFATFVTEDRPEGSTIADQKVQLLWSDADLVELRDQIRTRLR